MPNKKVKFTEDAEVFSAPREFGTDVEDANSCWYSKRELQLMRMHAAAIILSVRQGSNLQNVQHEQRFEQDELKTMHGIETLIRNDILEAQSSQRTSHNNAIMHEQLRQDRLHRHDIKALAAISTFHSRHASERARAIGFKHYIERV